MPAKTKTLGNTKSDHRRIYLYDTTLRDGAQTQGVDFNAADKDMIARALDDVGIDYIEGGWPGANPTDSTFFKNPPTLKRARLSVFGMTRRPGRSVENDPGLRPLFDAGTDVICLFGKTWDFHVTAALGTDVDENIKMIGESVALAATKAKEVIFDAEHFFDGYKANPEFALNCVKTAADAGARWIVLCDTNGGTLPDEIESIVTEVARHIPSEILGIHTHDDTGNAIAGTLAAVRAGVCQVQGTLNGLGERCGNANLVSIIPTLVLKMGLETGLTAEDLKKLTHLSHLIDDRLNRAPDGSAPYVGTRAFAHKGGVHASAVEKNPRTYEHINPETIGNQRHVVVSDQSGRANIIARFREIGLDVNPKHKDVGRLVELVKRQEYEGYAYDGAEASFELLARRTLGKVPDYFRCSSFRVIDERRWNHAGELITISEATVKLDVAGDAFMTVAEGNGSVNALDAALRKVLTPIFPMLKDLRLMDYKVRILTPGDGTRAITRVVIVTADADDNQWSTVGVSANIIDASYNALRDGLVYKLLKSDAVDAQSSDHG